MLDLLYKVRNALDELGSTATPLDPNEREFVPKRAGEQNYAKLFDPKTEVVNRYGQKIDLTQLEENLTPGVSMYINGNPKVGENPNRNKQHAFHFTADNCIGCHACEAACSEKNDNPPHISFRSVGYVEGGTYPDYKRMNISMACNHCDDPVCLKGCPTKAYTKHAEYGAVLQDPETCFGCGYCTWVCPYNAPQLDPIKGQVSKCNMCVDRLEEGLKPACVSACLGNALDFGVVENTPERREQCKTDIPGFPPSSITHPNIRFQQTKTLPNEMQRTDSQPLKYHKQSDGTYRSVVDEKMGKAKAWNLKRLSSRENPLVVFTLATQASMGAFVALFVGSFLGIDALQALRESVAFYPLLVVLLALQAVGLLLSTMHLGKPMRFYRGFNNLAHSPVAREAFGVALYFGGLGIYSLLHFANLLFDSGFISFVAFLFGMFALVALCGGMFYMYKSYQIKARPFWNHPQVATSFVGSMLSLGAVVLALIGAPVMAVYGLNWTGLLSTCAVMMVLGLALEGAGLIAHARYLNVEQGEGAAAHYVQCTTFAYSYLSRNVGIGLAMVLALASLLLLSSSSVLAAFLFVCAALLALASSIVGRALFYVLVIPTTMPGAFFWKNKSFEQHARDIGLANMPQVGVVPDLH
ncbi:MAG TPA: DmsC/YnfH family molybdoenzyme membrane anchor subunit [Pseudomonadales bacterium]|nr:DmsC/YnfH family molybdoenzyme membrane anchor subunit [Pseudomonadales bacterium]